MIAPEVCDLERSLDGALVTDIDELDGDTLADTAAALAVVAARLDALRAQVAGAVERSGVWAEREHGSPAALLRSLAPNRHVGEAGRDVLLARRLRDMPLAAEAFRAGSITAAHVKLLGECLHPRFEGQFAAFEAQLVDHAIELSFDAFSRLIRSWKSMADEMVDADDDLKDARARELYLSKTLKGRGELKGTLTPLARSIVGNELQRLEQKLFQDDWAEAVERLGQGNVTKDDLRRSPAQRRHDALVWMARRSAVADDASPLPETRVYVHVSQADLVEALEHDAGLDPEPVPYDESMRELADGTRISRATLLRLLVHSSVRRLVWGPDDELLSAGRSRRFFSAAQREIAIARDRTCSCGCCLPGWLCQMDHVVEWRDGGPTDVANARARCPRSHLEKTNRRRP